MRGYIEKLSRNKEKKGRDSISLPFFFFRHLVLICFISGICTGCNKDAICEPSEVRNCRLERLEGATLDWVYIPEGMVITELVFDSDNDNKLYFFNRIAGNDEIYELNIESGEAHLICETMSNDPLNLGVLPTGNLVFWDEALVAWNFNISSQDLSMIDLGMPVVKIVTNRQNSSFLAAKFQEDFWLKADVEGNIYDTLIDGVGGIVKQADETTAYSNSFFGIHKWDLIEDEVTYLNNEDQLQAFALAADREGFLYHANENGVYEYSIVGQSNVKILDNCLFDVFSSFSVSPDQQKMAMIRVESSTPFPEPHFIQTVASIYLYDFTDQSLEEIEFEVVE
ncbi:MAG: hypothetical protein HRT74_06385 [Flavobacteriales bacterium]|nr:hypothetical protein [Flavobacteriales bacterium]